MPGLEMGITARAAIRIDGANRLPHGPHSAREGSRPCYQGEHWSRSVDRSVALSGLLTALVRGALPTAPVLLVHADTPGTGKSYLIDLIATIATGRLCPVITASKSAEETEKRIGTLLLSGTPIVSLDNCTHDLGGELLCQLTERPVVKIENPRPLRDARL